MNKWRKAFQNTQTMGAWMYIASLQYFIIQIIVGLRWSAPYSLSNNTISDLGNTACGQYGSRYVCSPLFSLMNVSFVVLGLTMVIGSILLYRSVFRSEHKTEFGGFAGLTLAGIGVAMVGIFPENTIAALHAVGAFLPFLVGNAAILLLGFSKQFPVWLRRYSLLTGIITLIALGFYVSGNYLGLGTGGLERIVAYPQTCWLITTGLYVLLRRDANYSAK